MKKEEIDGNLAYKIASDSGAAPVFVISDGKFKKVGIIKNGEKVNGITYKIVNKGKEFNLLDAGGKYIPYQYLMLDTEEKSKADGNEEYDNTIGEYKDKIKNATKTINWYVAMPVTAVGGGIVYLIAGKVFPTLPKWATVGIGIAGGIGIALAVNKVMPNLYTKKTKSDEDLLGVKTKKEAGLLE